MKSICWAIVAVFSLFSVCMAGSQQVSSTTGSSMIAQVRADYNDTTSVYFTDAEMLQFLNDGIVDLVNKSHCYEATESISLVANTVEYSITSNYVEVVAVQYYNGTNKFALKKGSPAEIGLNTEESDTDAPAFWYEFAGKIGIYPSLSSVTTQTVTLYLVKWPVPIVSSGTISTPAIYDVALKYYILSRMALKDKNTAMHESMMGKYNQEIGFYRQDLQVKDQQK